MIVDLVRSGRKVGVTATGHSVIENPVSRATKLSLREPDLALYDELVPTPMTRDPGPSPTTTTDQEPAPDDQEAH